MGLYCLPISLLWVSSKNGLKNVILFCFRRHTHLSYANSADPDQTPRVAAFDLALHCLSLSF